MTFLEKVEQGGKWPQQACTTMFFLIPKMSRERAATCAYAYGDSVVGSLASARGGEMAHKYRFEWDATDGRNYRDGRNQIASKRKRSGSCSIGLGPGQSFRTSQSSCGLGLGCTSTSQGRYFGCFVETSSTRGGFNSKDVWRTRSRPSLPSCQSQSGLASTYCVAGCTK